MSLLQKFLPLQRYRDRISLLFGPSIARELNTYIVASQVEDKVRIPNVMHATVQILGPRLHAPVMT